MLALKLGLSLNNIKTSGASWSPDDESSLVAWYKNAAGITEDGGNVSAWADSSTNSFNMVQGTASKQPAYSAGVLTFDASTTEYLQTTSQITVEDEFTIGFRANPSAYNTTIIGDNTTSNEFFKYDASGAKIIVKIGGSNKNLSLDSGTFGDDYILITRDSSNLMTLYRNGVAQSSTQTLTGSVEIDAIGVREEDNNPFDGTIEEIQIYSSIDSKLTANVNAYLAEI
tara:strand:- start:2581 stop:3261 length:681 start_codon:yes stop_codon:yes gene_type:complete